MYASTVLTNTGIIQFKKLCVSMMLQHFRAHPRTMQCKNDATHSQRSPGCTEKESSVVKGNRKRLTVPTLHWSSDAFFIITQHNLEQASGERVCREQHYNHERTVNATSAQEWRFGWGLDPLCPLISQMFNASLFNSSYFHSWMRLWNSNSKKPRVDG